MQRVRAAKKLAARNTVTYLPDLRLEGVPDAAELANLPEGSISMDQFRRLAELIENMDAQGRFAILESGITDAHRQRIESMSREALVSEITALRGHLCVDALMSPTALYNRGDLAEKASRLVGDVALTWVNAQVREDLKAAEDARGHALETYMLDAEESAELNRRRKARDARRGRGVPLSDEDAAQVRSELARWREINERRVSARVALHAARDTLVDRRREVLVELLDDTVGLCHEPPSAKFKGKYVSANRECFARATGFFPESWVEDSEELGGLVVHGSDSRAKYTHNYPVQGDVWYDSGHPPSHEPGNEPREVTVDSHLRYRWTLEREVRTVVGGDPNNPEHVAIIDAAVERLNAEDAVWKKETPPRNGGAHRKTRWERRVDGDGRLRCLEVTCVGKGTVGHEQRMTVSPDISTMVHEFAHRVERGNPRIADVCVSFVRRRAAQDTDETGNMRDPIRYCDDREEVYADHFPHAYIGKLYDSPNTEVLTVGMEMLLFGKHGAGEGLMTSSDVYMRKEPDDDGVIVKDRDLLNMVTGLLFTARRTNGDKS